MNTSPYRKRSQLGYNHKVIMILGVLLFTLFLSGCISQDSNVEVTLDVIYTQAAQTVIARITNESVNLTKTLLPETKEPSQIPPTETVSPSATPTLTPPATDLPTATIIPSPTLSPTPSETPTPTKEAIPCDWAEFVGDITIADGTTLTPGVEFNKTWRLKNIGTCTWTEDYDIVFAAGERMNGPVALALTDSVLPGQSIDLSVQLTSPDNSGRYQGLWLLRNGDGVLFGLGEDANESFWVEIRVMEPEHKYPYDFAMNYCAAQWNSGTGPLLCPGYEDNSEGFVQLVFEPVLEGRQENEPTLWLHPNTDNDGWISGKYPEIMIKEGDTFQAWVGCLYDSEGCDITFLLSYQIGNGLIKNLGSWRETYDGSITAISLDISELENQSVQFILGVEVNVNPNRANAFWFVPRIERYGNIE